MKQRHEQLAVWLLTFLGDKTRVGYPEYFIHHAHHANLHLVTQGLRPRQPLQAIVRLEHRTVPAQHSVVAVDRVGVRLGRAQRTVCLGALPIKHSHKYLHAGSVVQICG